MKERNQSLDAIKGFTIILVMLGHCIVLNGLADGIVYDAIKSIQMPLFILMSGYLAGMSGPVTCKKDFLALFKKRSIAYLLPFFSWLFVTHITNFGVALKETLFQLDRGLWFLMTLYLLTMILALGRWFTYKTGWRIIGEGLAFGIFAGIFVGQILKGNTFLSPDLSVYYMPFYFVGYLCSAYCLKFLKGIYQKKETSWICFTVLTALFWYLVVKYDMITANNKIELLMQLTASFIGCCLCIFLVYHIKSGRLQAFLSYVGMYTLEIYVLHFRFATILNLADKNLVLVSSAGILWVVLTFFVMSVLTAFFIFTMKKLAIVDLLMFGKRHDSYTIKLPGVK